jgi:hypothetical protein
MFILIQIVSVTLAGLGPIFSEPSLYSMAIKKEQTQ